MISLRINLPKHIEIYEKEDDLQLGVYLKELHKDLKVAKIVECDDVTHGMVYFGNLRDERNRSLIEDLICRYPGKNLRTHRGHRNTAGGVR